jgi:predicted proteasome-type protease
MLRYSVGFKILRGELEFVRIDETKIKYNDANQMLIFAFKKLPLFNQDGARATFLCVGGNNMTTAKLDTSDKKLK